VPELPEVEVTRRRVAPLLVGRRIAEVRTGPPSYFFLTAPAVLRRRLAGRTVERLDRVGKYLLAALDSGETLLLHLGMTGQIFGSDVVSSRRLNLKRRARLEPAEAFEPDAHTHLCLRFEGGGPELMFRDVRKFGKVRLLPRGGSDPRLAKLGEDALDVTGAHLFEASRGRRACLKALLLDQSVLAGVGNIYADEALHLARLSPLRVARRLKRAEADRLAESVRQVLLGAIAAGGSSISDFIHPDGSAGDYQSEHLVYGRGGQPCPSCGRPIVRRVVAQRSTHFCSRCQR